MLLTVLEARVGEDRWDDLMAGYAEISSPLPPQMVASVLLQEASDRTVWRIASTWSSREALQEYRDAVDTPEGVALFRKLGAEPALTVFDVVARAQRGEATEASSQAAQEAG